MALNRLSKAVPRIMPELNQEQGGRAHHLRHTRSSAQMQKAQNSGYTAFVARTKKEITTCSIPGSEDNV